MLGGSIEEGEPVFDSRPKRSRSDFRRSAAKFGRRELGTPRIKVTNEQHADAACSNSQR
jgi:hypothetical protein